MDAEYTGEHIVSVAMYSGGVACLSAHGHRQVREGGSLGLSLGLPNANAYYCCALQWEIPNIKGQFPENKVYSEKFEIGTYIW